MANYKDRILGGIFDIADTLTTKAKEITESEAVRGAYEKGTAKAKAYARLAKLKLEVTTTTEELNKVYMEIGKQAYEKMKASPEGFFAALFIQANELETVLEAKQAELEALRTELGAPAGDLGEDMQDFDAVVVDAEAAVPAAEEPAASDFEITFESEPRE